MLYKLQEGLTEESLDKMNKELERTARMVVHPLSTVVVEAPQPVTSTSKKKRERTPPPGWKSEREAFNTAMQVMTFVGKR